MGVPRRARRRVYKHPLPMHTVFDEGQLAALRERYAALPPGAAEGRFGVFLSTCATSALAQVGDAGINLLSRAARTELRRRARERRG